MRRAARSGRFSHLVYLEDDIGFTDAHLSYWCTYREPLERLGLLPGFVRFEQIDGTKYVVDQTDRVDPRRRRVALSGPENGVCRDFVNLPNPYQGFYVLDTVLADQHLRFSPSRSAFLSQVRPWAVRARAATGPIFDDVPGTLRTRNVVPIIEDHGRTQLGHECLIEHMGTTYALDPDTTLGSIPVEDLFEEVPTPPSGAS